MFRWFTSKAKDQNKLAELKLRLETYREEDSIPGLWDQAGVAILYILEEISEATGIAEERMLNLENLTLEEASLVKPFLTPPERVLETADFYDRYSYGLLNALFSLHYQFPDASRQIHGQLVPLIKDYSAFYQRVVGGGQTVRAELYNEINDWD